MHVAVKNVPTEKRDRSRKMRSVCIVDDNEDMRDVLARLVRTVGLRPELYHSAEAFLQRTDGAQIGCLLLDVQLGGMSGLELLTQLSNKQVTYPVFLISAAHTSQTVAHAKQYGAIVVDKPFDARKLGQEVLDSVRAPGA